MALTGKTMSIAAAKAKALGAFYTFPAIILSSLIVSWAAEAAQFFISQGLALAILAWLQTLPEFMVEATIAWKRDIHLMTANITGSLRLLVGLGWPLVYFTTAFSRKAGSVKERFAPIVFKEVHAIEIAAMIPPTVYFLFIYLKARLTLWDALILIVMYLVYLYMLRKIPCEDSESAEDLPVIPRRIIGMRPRARIAAIAALFLVGGLLLLFTVGPFLESMMGIAIISGISSFTFVQWCAPFLTEFPEKLSAFKWARTIKGASMAVMNLISSIINQWTLLAAMLPIVYSVSLGYPSFIPFDHHQRSEILLTIAQSGLAFMLVGRMRLTCGSALSLFFLWLIQFILPGTRALMAFGYALGIVAVLIYLAATKRRITVFDNLITVGRTYCLPVSNRSRK
jgi:cation:H+ antiporter